MASVEAAVCLLADTSFAHELETSTCKKKKFKKKEIKTIQKIYLLLKSSFAYFYFTKKDVRKHPTFLINISNECN